MSEHTYKLYGPRKIEFLARTYTLPLGQHERVILHRLCVHGRATTYQLIGCVAAAEPTKMSVMDPDRAAVHIRVAIHRARAKLKGSGWTISKCKGGAGQIGVYELLKTGRARGGNKAA